MGFINLLQSFARVVTHGANVSDAKVDPGGGALVTPQHFEDAGSDSHPMPGDYVATMPVPRSGSVVAIGYVDPKSLQQAAAGEKIIYARDANGDEIAKVWCKNDGTILASNANGSIELKPNGEIVSTSPLATLTMDTLGSIKGANSNGDFELEASGTFLVNTATISPGGAGALASLNCPSIVVVGVQVKDHVHLAGSPPGDTGIMK